MISETSIIKAVGLMFPDRRPAEVRRYSLGWNNIVILLDNDVVVKLPKGPKEREKLEKEIAVTAFISQRLPVEVPNFFAELRNGNLHAAAYARLEGVMLTNMVDISDSTEFQREGLLNAAQRRLVTCQIAEILSSIHGRDAVAMGSILGRFERTSWRERVLCEISEARTALCSLPMDTLPKNCIEVLDDLEQRIKSMVWRECFIHGDFGGWNILYSRELGRLSGILDWGSSSLGDPAYDFAELMYDYGERFANNVLSNYEFSNNGDLIGRARTYLKLAGFLDLAYGVRTRSDYFIKKGVKGIRILSVGNES